MALTATVHRVSLSISDVDRGVYESTELRIAQHPSESLRFLMARVLGYSLFYEDGIVFGRGVSTAEEPALWVKDLSGTIKVWIDVGRPSADRLHRASKLGARVAVLCHQDVSLLLRDLAKATVHRKEELELWELPASLLDAMEQRWERGAEIAVMRNDGSLYVTLGGATLEGPLVRHVLT